MRLLISMILMVTVSAGPAVAAPGNAAKGRTQFIQCSMCHSLQLDGPRKLGPNLVGIVGRRAASLTDYPNYSKALITSRITWTPDRLDAFLAAPAKLVPGTRMTVGGVPDPQTRANIIAYLKAGR